MARPSRNTDQRLIQAAMSLLPEKGCTGLSLRQVAQRAGVNLGMFHYHFKTKDEFVRQVLQGIYDAMIKELTEEIGRQPGAAEERLKRGLAAFGRFSRNNRKLILALVRDLLTGDPTVADFVRSNFERHIRLLASLLTDCERAGRLALPLPTAFIMIMGTVNLPNLLFEVAERNPSRKPLGIGVRELEALFISDAAITARADFAVNAITKTSTKKRRTRSTA